MADDIDIEEHDVMDNPVVRRIFPDITVIKKEIEDYFKEESHINHSKKEIIAQKPAEIVLDFQNPDSTTEDTITNDSSKEIRNYRKEDLITKTSNETKGVFPVNAKWVESSSNNEVFHSANSILGSDNTTMNPAKERVIETKELTNSKIILGSKPNKSLDHTQYCDGNIKSYEVKVVLEDYSFYIKKSKQFCRKCLILFSKKYDLDDHNKKIHSRNAVKNHSVNDYKPTKNKRSFIKQKCNICNSLISSRSNLIRHMKNIHAMKMKRERRKKKDLSSVKKDDNSSRCLTSKNTCFHCSKIFSNQQSLIEHIYEILQTKNNIPNKNTNENVICQKLFKYTSQFGEQVENSNRALIQKDQSDITHLELESNDEKLDPKIGKSIKVYICRICLHYFKNVKVYIQHMKKKHNIFKIIKPKMVSFNPNCRYCSSKSDTLKSYNHHMNKFHGKQMKHTMKTYTKRNETEIVGEIEELSPVMKQTKNNKQTKNASHSPDINDTFNIDKNSFALVSVLFKCNKCDIHFLSAKVTVGHLDHMELLVNWKCLKCQRIFKEKDKKLHEQQHLFSHTFTVYDICQSDYRQLLYSCPKCAIHFIEEDFKSHFSVCGTETPNAKLCKNCDILIDSKKMNLHEENHSKVNKFIIIEPDGLLDDKNNNLKKNDNKDCKKLKRKITENDNEVSVTKRVCKRAFIEYIYCDTCKCFITQYHNDLHINSECAHLVKYVCNLCGLLFTNKSINTHRMVHKRHKGLKLEEFAFTDLKSGKGIPPPIPEYPNCKICGIHFVSKNARDRHLCTESEDEYLTCHICQVKFSEAAFKLHMPFHYYSFKNTSDLLNINSHEVKSSNIEESTSLKSLEVTLPAHEPSDVLNIIYCCKSCRTAVHTYSEVVEHCQAHYNKANESPTKICNMCNFKIENTMYEIHLERHSYKKAVKLLKFDIFYFALENEAWTKHLFGGLPEEQKDAILNESIYRHGHKMKMEIIQEGPSDLTLYRCDKCHCFIDPFMLYEHTVSNCIEKIRKHTCTLCGLPFISCTYREQHEKIHKRPNIIEKSYRIVIFNKEQDREFNKVLSSRNMYVLYQCRHCEGVIDRTKLKSHQCNLSDLNKCPDCGLLLYSDQYDSHVSKHTNFNSFTSENMKVVLLGEKGRHLSLSDETITSSFNGIICDYTFYKCTKCQLCVKNIQKHTCAYSSNSVKQSCPTCNLYFFRMNYHLKLHDNDPHFIRENMRIIPFSQTETKNTEEENNVIDKTGSSNMLNETGDVPDFDKQNYEDPSGKLNSKKSNDVASMIATIYKCTCGLHFLNEETLSTHFKQCTSGRFSKQVCSKCDLLFTPNILFSHLLIHHGNKKHTYKFNIIEMSKEKNDE